MAGKPKSSKQKKILFVLAGCLLLCLAALVVVILLARASADKKHQQTAGPVPQPATMITSDTMDQVCELYYLPMEGFLHDVTWSPDGQILAAGTARLGDIPGRVRLWDAESGAELHVFEDGDVDRLAFSPDGSLLAAGGGAGVTVWRMADFNQANHIPLGNPIIVDVGFSPDNRYLAYSAGDAVVLLEMPSGKEFRTLNPDGDLRDFAFMPGGKTLMTAAIIGSDSDGETEFSEWEIAGGEVLDRFRQPGRLDDFALYPDGATFAGTFSVTSLRVWERESGNTIHSMEGFRFGTTRFALSPTGGVMAAGEGRGFETASPSGLRLFSLKTGQEAPMIQGHTGVIKSLAFSPDDRYLATAAEDHSVRIWGVPPGVLDTAAP